MGTEIRFEEVWEQDHDVVVRAEGERLIIELVSAQCGVVARAEKNAMQVACDMENGGLTFAIVRA